MPEPGASPQSPSRPPVLAGRYELVRTQEMRPNAASILAYDTRLKRWRAVHVARPGDHQAAAALIGQAQQAAPLEHPGLERVIDVGTDGSVAFVVRDYFIASVEDQLSRRAGVSPGWALHLLTRISDGLSWAHERGVVHGHPRPEVVRFTEEGEPVLTGFGTRAVLRDDSETRGGPAWAHLAPELRQYWEPTVQTDVYALGALFYTLLAGRHAADLFYAEAYEGLLAPVPRSLRGIVTRACALTPGERFGSVSELHKALSRVKGIDAPRGMAPWLEITQDFPDRRDYAPDRILTEISAALGHRPPEAAAKPVDDDGTIDPTTGDRGGVLLGGPRDPHPAAPSHGPAPRQGTAPPAPRAPTPAAPIRSRAPDHRSHPGAPGRGQRPGGPQGNRHYRSQPPPAARRYAPIPPPRDYQSQIPAPPREYRSQPPAPPRERSADARSQPPALPRGYASPQPGSPGGPTRDYQSQAPAPAREYRSQIPAQGFSTPPARDLASRPPAMGGEVLPDYIDPHSAIGARASATPPPARRISPELGSTRPPLRHNRRAQVGLLSLLVGILSMGALVCTIAVGVGWYVLTYSARVDNTLVEAVLAEQAAVGRMVVSDKELHQVWEVFVTAPETDRAREASDFVRAVEIRADAAPLPTEVDRSIRRMVRAEEHWNRWRDPFRLR